MSYICMVNNYADVKMNLCDVPCKPIKSNLTHLCSGSFANHRSHTLKVWNAVQTYQGRYHQVAQKMLRNVFL